MRPALKRLLSLRAALVLAGAGVLVVNCSQSDTVLLVHVTATAGGVDGIQQLHTTVRVGGQTHVIDVPDAPVAIALPTSFTVQLARSFNGDLSVNVDARDGGGTTVASGNQTLSPLHVGEQNELTIDLAPGAAPDGGMDGPPNTAGTGGVMGSGGIVGTGGMVEGSGGATAGASGASGGSPGSGGAAGGGAGGHGGGGGRGGTVGSGGHAGGASGSGGNRPASGGTVGSGGMVSSGGVVGSGGAASGGVPGSGGSDAGGSSAGGSGDMGGAAGSS
jgi:hypothetical protein